MTNKKNFFNLTELEFLGNEDLSKVNGGSTSIAYDIGTFFRMSFQQIGGDRGGAVTTFAKWYSYQ